MIKELSYRNFKAFEKIDLELAPITLFLGPNNSGKSSILSGLKIMNQTLNSSDENVRMLLRGKNGDFGSYKDIVHGNSATKHMELKLSIIRSSPINSKKLDNEKVSIDIKYKYRTKIQEIIAKEIELKTGRADIKVSYSDDNERFQIDRLLGKNVPPGIKASLSKDLRVDNYIPYYRRRLSFDKEKNSQSELFMEEINKSRLNRLNRASVDMRNTLSDIEYVGAMRLSPERTFMYTGEKRKSVGPNGEYAINILAMDMLRKGKKTKNIKENVERWLDNADISSELIINKISDRHFELKIRNKETDELQNYADVGYGNSQILPVLVAGYNLEAGETLVIEEPEIHLHPKAQFCIGDYLNDLLKNGVQSLVETHSEHLVLRIQQLIASGIIDPGQVAIYYIWAEEGAKWYQQISMNEHGEFVEEWPLGFFPERYEAAKQLSRTRYGVL